MIEVFRKLGMSPLCCAAELTLACDLSCKHCGSYAGRARGSELALEQWLAIVGELAELGCKRLTLSGGEPTLYRGWDQIAAQAVSKGIATNLISNGWSWSSEHARQALRAGMYAVGFSLDGLEAAHDAFRREGSFRRVLAAVETCHGVGLQVSVNTSLHAGNADQLLELRTLLLGLGVRAWQLQVALPTGAMAANRQLAMPAYRMLDVVPLIASFCRESTERLRVYASDHIGHHGACEPDLRDEDPELPFWMGCRAGLQVLGIESNGNIKGCLSLPSERHGVVGFVEGNACRQGLRAVWSRSGAFPYTRGFEPGQLGGFCAVCRFGDICRGGCTWKRICQGPGMTHTEYCLYHQAVKHRRYDLIAEEPTTQERAYFDSARPAAGTLAAGG